MSLPSAFSFAARAVTASVGEGLTRWTRRESWLGTGETLSMWVEGWGGSNGRVYYAIRSFEPRASECVNPQKT